MGTTEMAKLSVMDWVRIEALKACVLLILALRSARANGQNQTSAGTGTGFTAMLVFGDSTADTGNNNDNLRTVARANFPPYGRDFANHVATGRFSNGKIGIDFMSEGLGMKDKIPAYLDPRLTVEDLLTGVSFASANSGIDTLTSRLSSVISLGKQLEYFREYKKRIESAVGKRKSEYLIKNALFLLSVGSNDFLANYFVVPIRQRQYSMEEFQQMLVRATSEFLQELINEGASRIAVIGLSPLGSLPFVRTESRQNSEPESTAAADFNNKLMALVNSFSSSANPRDLRIVFIDTYSIFADIISNPYAYGLEANESGCCGMGLAVAGIFCNTGVPVCADASKYVFWDAVHPTESVYKIEADLFVRRDLLRLLPSP
eukprot:TRINITY_DN35629_c0_g1_i1.p1 TRINITY_DN35629_c0_g1~~TRINITY_DN35629_c0_g1_i1.p1  ORF type:complete len:375 (-),score=4.43 TRINITY_DN35629_c0_g1_i1:62-1186(-)